MWYSAGYFYFRWDKLQDILNKAIYAHSKCYGIRNFRKKVRITRKNSRNITNRRWDLTSYRSSRHWLPARFEYRIVIAWTPRLAITKLIVSEFSQAIISRFHWESCKNKFFFDIVWNEMAKDLLKSTIQFYPSHFNITLQVEDIFWPAVLPII